MKTKYILTLLTLFIILALPAQTNLNDYKYVVMPRKFDFLKEVDHYQLNSLTKFLFNKNKFNVFFDDENFPEDLSKNRCLTLFANVLQSKSLFTTKLTVELKDCYNNVVFVSKEGSSKEKNFKKAYHQSIREAFESFKSVNYTYSPKEINNQEIENITTDKENQLDPIPAHEKVIKVIETKSDSKLALPVPVTPEIPEKAEVKDELKNNDKKPSSEQIIPSDILYAQAIQGGFQLVDKSPKVVYTIFQSGKKEVFIVKGKDAIIYKLNDIWVLAEQFDDNLKVTSMNIKF